MTIDKDILLQELKEIRQRMNGYSVKQRMKLLRNAKRKINKKIA